MSGVNSLFVANNVYGLCNNVCNGLKNESEKHWNIRDFG